MENGSAIYVEPDGRCAAALSSELAVLACSLPAGHDEGFVRSRELAASFCEAVAMDARRSFLDPDALSRLVDELFSCAEWRGWHLSFCVAERQGEQVRAFNCGVGGVALITTGGDVREVLPPNTIGRKLRREGVAVVPPHVEYIGAKVAGKGLVPQAISNATVEASECTAVVAVAEPRIMDSLAGLSKPTSEYGEIGVALQASFDAMVNPTRAFVLWNPSISREERLLVK